MAQSDKADGSQVAQLSSGNLTGPRSRLTKAMFGEGEPRVGPAAPERLDGIIGRTNTYWAAIDASMLSVTNQYTDPPATLSPP